MQAPTNIPLAPSDAKANQSICTVLSGTAMQFFRALLFRFSSFYVPFALCSVAQLTKCFYLGSHLALFSFCLRLLSGGAIPSLGLSPTCCVVKASRRSKYAGKSSSRCARFGICDSSSSSRVCDDSTQRSHTKERTCAMAYYLWDAT
jgi:hypothetical protein